MDLWSPRKGEITIVYYSSFAVEQKNNELSFITQQKRKFFEKSKNSSLFTVGLITHFSRILCLLKPCLIDFSQIVTIYYINNIESLAMKMSISRRKHLEK